VDPPDSHRIVTPEGVAVDLPLAGVGSRGAAVAIDLVIKTLALLGLALAVDQSTGGASFALRLAVVIVAAFLLVFGYDIAFEAFNRGRTPGKMFLRLRVVREEGQPIGFLASTIRTLLRIVDFLPAGYLVGIVSILVTRRAQRLGDLAAGTIVLQEGQAEAVPVAGEWVPEGWDVSAVTDEELSAVTTFLTRREKLHRDARDRLARRLQQRLEPRVVRPPTQVLSPERFLEIVAAAKTARRA